MAEELTVQQRAAVENRGGKLLVSAAAGSGKTKVLVDRLLAYMLDSAKPANIDDFLIITFTEAAAAELRSKIASKLSEHLAADPGNRHLQRQLQRLYLAKISTVHAFCSGILREYAYLLDIPADYRVADDNLSTQLKDRAMEQTLDHAYEILGSDKDLQSLLDMQGLGRNDSAVPDILKKVFDSAQCYPEPEAWLDSCVTNAQVENVSDVSETVWGRYLMDAFFSWLDLQIRSMEACVTAVENMPGQEKPAQLLRGNVEDMRSLRRCTTWDALASHGSIDFGTLRFAKKTEDVEISKRVKAVRKACKTGLELRLRSFSDRSSQVLSDLRLVASSARGLVYLVKDFTQRYELLKRRRRLLDFNDLEHFMLRLLASSKSVTEEIAARYREVMVDEYQDTNAVQDAIYERLTQKRNNLFMVGDVKQSIYQFRQADPQIFLDKYADYVPADKAAEGQGRKVVLSQNFRSGGGVIHCVNDVFRDCMCPQVGGLEYGADEMLYPGIERCALEEPEVELHCLQTGSGGSAEEAEFVAERIVQLLDEKHTVRLDKDTTRPITPGDIAIILRAPGPVAMEYRQALARRRIPCVSESGMDLLMTQEGGTFYAFLQTVSNPRQDIPLITVLLSPVFAFTADELASVRSAHGGCFYDALRRSELPKCREFVAMLRQLRRSAGLLTLPELLQKIFRDTHMDGIYSAMSEGEARRNNLNTFYTLAVRFAAGGTGDLDGYLEHIRTLSEDGRLSASQQSGIDAVTIISIHKSKGLEYPVVFASDLSRKFSRRSQQGNVLCHKDLGLGLNCVDVKNRIRYASVSKNAIAARIAEDNLSEEMRLLYVALTRARDRLIMTYASRYLEKDINDIAHTMDICGKLSVVMSANCPGDWVLYSALKRTEAGALFAYGDRPQQTALREDTWLIRVHTESAETTKALPELPEPIAKLPAQTVDALSKALHFRYPYQAATQAPSKLTATQPKGRIKDAEVAEMADEPKPVHRSWRKARFAEGKLSGREYGNAIHSIMQHADYAACRSFADMISELDRLRSRGLLSQQEREAVDESSLYGFFDSPFGKRLCQAKQVLREFKFTILDDGALHEAGLQGEQVLLQGVVDCAIVEEDGITVLDFKTDRVSEDTLDAAVDTYRGQVEIYANALRRIYKLPIKQKLLYFFRLGKYVEL